MRKNIFKAFSVCLAFVIASVSLFAGAEGVVTYYAQIKGLDAIYDRFTETVDFDIEIDGAVFESHSFTVSVICSKYEGGEWVENHEYATQSFLYSDCHTAPKHFTGSVSLKKADFLGSLYKDFTLFVCGSEVEAGSAIGGKYYTMDSAEKPITLKGIPEGDFYSLKADIAPKESVKGGTVVLTLTVADINPLLSGGLCSFGFAVEYDNSLLLPTEATLYANQQGCSLDGASITADGIKLQLSASGGLKPGKSAEIKLFFRAQQGGTASFSVKNLEGADIADHKYSNAGFPLPVTALISDVSADKGDVNGDGEVNNVDAALILKYDAGIIDDVENADVNGDGEANNVDAALILKYDAGIIDGFDGTN